jgi:hypothetical protein
VFTECYNGSSELAVDWEHIMLNSTLATQQSSNCRNMTKNVSIFCSVKVYENDWKIN